MMHINHDTDVLEEVKVEVILPTNYKVVFFNDNVTPFQFVMFILCEVFHKTVEESEKITANIHHNGSEIVGVYTEEIAEMKRDEALSLVKEAKFPLRIEIEAE